MRPFDGVDFYLFDSQLNEEEKLVRQSVRTWVQEKYLPIVEEHFEHATFPTQMIPEIAHLGVLGANLPTDYGCAGLGDVAYGLCMQELEAGDSGLRSFVSVQGALVMYPIFTFGSEEQRQYWLPKLAAGEKIGCFGLTEPDFGSNPSGMATKAVKTSDGYVLSGAKMWITNGTIADVAVVWAKLDGRIQGFLVEKGWKGFTAPEQKRKFSLRASVTSELILQDVHVPETHILPKAQGLKAPLSCLTAARYGIAWGALGAAMACYHAAVEYAKTRVQFDRPIGGFQLVQERLADMLTEITKGQAICLQLGRLKESGLSKPEMVSLAKRNNVAVALDIARWARDILGANGITSEYPVMRHMANLESVKTYEGTHNIHTLVLGEAITGIAAYR
ncbi:MAG TPA: acyl-CoA dehydrogenase family protein [Candidatus Eisenbacteria bacterium]|jgi:glutaryl-CoA dehydrogenase|nr:acyl-CoA dehydrogenase family protein [Candidatus Eisenbacteria bacterium]